MYVYSFEKLEVWKESKNFTKKIYELTSKFPNAEKFGLTSQIRRASVSICSNIAEGSARKTDKDKAHYTTMSFNSAVEVLNQLIISKELGFLSDEQYQNYRSLIEKHNEQIEFSKKLPNQQIIESTNYK